MITAVCATLSPTKGPAHVLCLPAVPCSLPEAKRTQDSCPSLLYHAEQGTASILSYVSFNHTKAL